MSSPTSRSLALLRSQGYVADVVERFNSFTKRRNDFLGIGDIIGLGPDVVIVQTTSGSNVSARLKKIEASEHIDAIRKAGVRVIVHGWAKKANGRWACREIDVS